MQFVIGTESVSGANCRKPRKLHLVAYATPFSFLHFAHLVFCA
jgi:hypothetical protein